MTPDQQPEQSFLPPDVRKQLIDDTRRLTEAKTRRERGVETADTIVLGALVGDAGFLTHFATKGLPTTILEGVLDAAALVLINGLPAWNRIRAGRRLNEAEQAFKDFRNQPSQENDQPNG